ncbi:MAG: DUF4388 domain-containing protein [Candidatus Obscuribacter sp.]|nr:DUF4388 domain-containing protein [Candidatus Obscuribacter sp.]
MESNKRITIGSFINPGPAAQPAESPLLQALQGDLSDRPISYLLSVANHYDATGHMRVGPRSCEVVIQFGLGKPICAFSPLGKGEEVILDLFTWAHGSVSFDNNIQPDAVNISESLDKIVLCGETYAQDSAFLEQYLINEQSILVRGARMSPEVASRCIKQCKTLESSVLSEFYSSIYGTLNLGDVAEKLGLRRSQWVMAAAHFLKQGALLAPDGTSLKVPDLTAEVFRDNAPLLEPISQTQSDLDVVELAESSTVAAPPSTGFSLPNASTSWPGQISPDKNPVKTSEKPQTSPVMAVGLPPSPVALKLKVGKHSLDLLNNPDTSLLRHDVFEYLLAMEFARACRFGSSLSLVVFCLRVPQAASQTIPLSQLLTVLGQVDNLRREVDVFGHFGDRTFALLLPNVDPEQAAGLADRLNRELAGLLSPESTGGAAPLSLHFGIAGAPLDATELSALSMAAQVAMKAAVDAGSLRTLYSQLKR